MLARRTIALVVTVERDERRRLAVVSVDDPWPQPLVRTVAGLDPIGDEGHAAVSPDRRLGRLRVHARAPI